MTQTEYLQLKSTLVAGCSPERFDFINGMLTRQRAEFTMGLTLAPSDHLVERTWQMLAISLAGDVLALLRQLDQPAACEMKEAVSTAELTAPEAPVTISATFDHILQEVL